MVGLIEDIDYLKDFHPEAGHKLYLVGETRDDFVVAKLKNYYTVKSIMNLKQLI